VPEAAKSIYWLQQVPVAAEPPDAVQSSGLMTEQVSTGQSASVSHAFVGSVSHVPSAVPSPGIESPEQVVSIVSTQATASDLPHVDPAAHGTTEFRQFDFIPALCASVFRALLMHFMYCP
jgi:hypothetical protein